MGLEKDCLQEEKLIIVNLWNDGKKLTEIAEISNCSRKMVYNITISFKANIIISQKTKTKVTCQGSPVVKEGFYNSALFLFLELFFHNFKNTISIFVTILLLFNEIYHFYYRNFNLCYFTVQLISNF